MSKQHQVSQQAAPASSGHGWAPSPQKQPRTQHQSSGGDSLRVSLILAIVIIGLVLIGGMILGALSILDALRGHPGMSWQHLTAWVDSVKVWIIAAVALIVAVKVAPPFLEVRAHTAEQRGIGALRRAEAKRIREQARRERDIRLHNRDNMPRVYIALSDGMGNYGQAFTGGYLLPGNTEKGNAGLNKQLLDMLAQQNAVDADFYEEEDEPVLQIEAPKKILLSQQIECGITAPDERESVFGYPIDTHEPMKVVLFEKEKNFINSLFVIGEQGQGKSTIGTYFAALTVNHRGYILVIDPDAEEEQSLSSRLGPLKAFLLCEVADTPEKAERVLDIAESEIANPGEYPALLLVDEFSMIMRQKKLGGKWKAVADRVAEVVENWATRGRKRRKRVVVFGQISNASRTGGTELRDVCAAVVFNTAVKKAERVLDNASDEEIAELAPSLTPGTAIVLPAGSSETFIMQFPFPDDRGLQIIAEVRAESDELAGSNYVQTAFMDELETGSRTFAEPSLNVDELALQADVRKVRNLYGKQTQDEIIYALWGARKGGTQKYKDARVRYQAIAVFIETGQWPVEREA